MRRKTLLFHLLALSLSSTLAMPVEGENEANEDNKCTLPQAAGNCKARKKRIFFNLETKKCEVFFFSGCGGNANQFKTMAECNEACPSHAASRQQEENKVDPSEATTTTTTNTTRPPHCLLPPIHLEARRCRAAFPRYTFNSRTNQCNSYLYGGCGGTQNLYTNAEECLSACQELQPKAAKSGRSGGGGRHSVTIDHDVIVFPGFAETAAVDVCHLPPTSPGPIACLAYMEKWTYDSAIGECVKYVYGGCRGTANLFETKESCEERCKKDVRTLTSSSTPPARCLQPPMKPHAPVACMAFMPKFTYNSEKGRCESFIYGGCFGSENLFDTEMECATVCDPENVPRKRTVEVCGLVVDAGKACAGSGGGGGAKPSFAFNSETRRCELFLYAGCEGNDNRFTSVQECVDTCGGLEPSENPLCTFVTCNEEEASLNRAKACQPVIKAGECCPSSWDCTGAWEERLQRMDQCFVANREVPEGRYYSVGEPMPEISRGCTVRCICGAGGKPICASVDCPPQQPAMISNDQDNDETTTTADCRTLYSDVSSCCPSETKCGEDLSSLQTCQFENQTYYHGQRMYPPEDPCRVCQCGPGWTGAANDESSCYTVDCFSQRADKLARGCQPVYMDRVCCPIDWICPSSSANGPPPMPAKASVACPEGSSVLEDAAADVTVFPEIEPLSNAEGYENDIRPDASDVCLLPQPKGPCTGFEEMWHFDMQRRTCLKFMYGGFEYSENVFESEDDCRQVCSRYLLDDNDNSNRNKRTRCVAESEGGELATSPPKADRCRPKNAFKYNKSSKKCEGYVHLGCRTNNSSSFSSIDECEAVCSPAKNSNFPGKEESCGLPVLPGNCRSRMRRFYYDGASGLCRQFWYSGCQGNDNNFDDERSCILKCVGPEQVSRAVQGQTLDVRSPCSQPKEGGPCRGEKPRWYYDGDTETCRLFMYGGCQGNDNNFESLQQCSQTCRINWPSQRKVRQACHQPVAVGPCRASEPRYYFSRESDRCERFLYGGCDGNENNFVTKTDCMLTCKFSLRHGGLIVSPPPSSSSSLSPSLPRSHMSAVSPQSSFSSSDDSDLGSRVIQVGPAVTLPFERGQRGGHGQQVTLQELHDPCNLDKEMGRCRASFKRFYFDRDAKRCRHFNYGGCQGNDNNFGTVQQCEMVCQKHMVVKNDDENNDEEGEPQQRQQQQHSVSVAIASNPACSEPVDAGPCKSVRPKWFFNSTSDRCERFFWGGCKGNLNRFHTKEECQTSCPSSSSPSKISLPVTPPKCVHGSRSFNLGDVIRFNEDKCRKCTCNSPPSLTCIRRACKPLPPMPNLSSGAICEETFDDDGCCAVGFQCVSANPPTISTPMEEQESSSSSSSSSSCEAKSCPEIRSFPIGDEAAGGCVEEKDEEGCCVIGVKCEAKVVVVADPCAKRVCKAIGFLPKRGKTCTERKDQDGCCVVGLDCV